MNKRTLHINNDKTCHQDIYAERKVSLSMHCSGEIELTETVLAAIYGGLASPSGASQNVHPQTIGYRSATPQTGASQNATPQTGASQNPDALPQMQEKLEEEFQGGLLQQLLGSQELDQLFSF